MESIKYLRLKQVVVISTIMLIFSLLIVVPVQALIEGVSLSNWPLVYRKFLVICSPIYLSAIALAWLFCELYRTRISRIISALMFGALSPVIFFITLSLFMSVFVGVTIHGLNSPEGIQNLFFLYLLFGSLSFAIYWGASDA